MFRNVLPLITQSKGDDFSEGREYASYTLPYLVVCLKAIYILSVRSLLVLYKMKSIEGVDLRIEALFKLAFLVPIIQSLCLYVSMQSSTDS